MSIGLFPDLTRSQKVIQMGMGMYECDDVQTQPLDCLHDQLRVATGVKYIAVASFSITKDRAIALQGAYGEAVVNYSHGCL
jgi:hypothetical protein